MKLKKILFAFGVVLLLSSCQTVRNFESQTSPVYVTNTKKIFILPPSCIEEPLDTMQMVLGKFGEQTFTLLGLLQADETSVTLSLFNDFGTDMGTLFYDGYTASFASSVFPPELKAEYVINDLQCAYYRTDKLEENFSRYGLKFIVEDEGKTRKVMSGNKLIEEIILNPGEVKIINHLRGYEYNLVQADE